MPKPPKRGIKIFADGANAQIMQEQYRQGLVRGFTTNPTLLRKAGVDDYASFAKKVLSEIKDLPISFEVFADDLENMEKEARVVAGWGSNVYVKIPITTTQGLPTSKVVSRLSADNIRVNVTAVLTFEQVRIALRALHPRTPAVVSIFAGRIADTGRDPSPLMHKAAQLIKTKRPMVELLWASSREVLNIFQAQACGCQIITLTPELIKKIPNLGKDLSEISLETVRMFYHDAQTAGYKIVD
jgi:transaldolase